MIAITSKQFLSVNGMSNEYYGWGGEDDDFYSRLEAMNLKICRFGPDISRYHMVKHESQKKGYDNTFFLFLGFINLVRIIFRFVYAVITL